MTKSELKTGHIVTTRNGNEYTVLKGVDTEYTYDESNFLVRSNGFLRLSRYNEDLTHKDDHEWDVIKVERMKGICDILADPIHQEKRITLWPTKKQYTYAQLREILGEEFEVVG